jgi:hypothetical protein
MNSGQHGAVKWIKAAVGLMILSWVGTAVAVAMAHYRFGLLAREGAVDVSAIGDRIGPALIFGAISSGLFGIGLIVLVVAVICYFQARGGTGGAVSGDAAGLGRGV